MAMLGKNSSQKLRFITVGGANTVIDFGLLFILKSLGLPAVGANFISTSAAFCFSFFANKKFTFKTVDVNLKREISLFVVVTLFGLWGIQTAVITLVTQLLASTGWQNDMILLAAKLCATVASLTWNYIMYSRVVFRQRSD